MTDQTPSNEASPAAKRKGFWSLASDEDSVERGQNNFWAMLETVLAIVAFWYVALKYETLSLLYSSLFIAPLLFLRSLESVRQGVQWVDNGPFRPIQPQEPQAQADVEKALGRRLMWIAAGIALVCLNVAVYESWGLLARDYHWDWIWRFALFHCLCTCIAIGGAVVGARAIARAGVLAGAVSGAGARLGALLGAISLAIVAAAIATSAVESGRDILVMAGVVMTAGVVTDLTLGTLGVVLAIALAVAILFFPAFLFGLWIVALAIRVFATGRHLFAGYRQAPANIERLALRTAPFHLPELLPGLPRYHHLHLRGFAASCIFHIRKGGVKDKFLAACLLILFPFIFIPGWTYRVILKSTLWFWWVLFIVAGAPKIKEGIEGLRVDVYLKSTARLGIALAIFILGVALGPGLLEALVKNHSSETPLLVPLVALRFLFDWSNWKIYQGVSLAAAIVTIIVVVWCHNLVVDWERVPARRQKVTDQLPSLGRLVQWKIAIGMLSTALTMLYFALYANAQHGQPPDSDSWSAQWLQKLYGENAKALLRRSSP